MTRRGRRPKTIPTHRMEIWMPEDLMARFNLLFLDPLTGRLRTGERSALVEQLVRDYLSSLAKDPQQ